MLTKILAIIAAILLVGSVALGTLGPPDMTLGDGLIVLDRLRLAAVEGFVRSHLSGWVWDKPMMALLIRPIWMVPAAIGLIFAGAAMTAASSGKASTSRRRRS
jgi:hypothetical protein